MMPTVMALTKMMIVMILIQIQTIVVNDLDCDGIINTDDSDDDGDGILEFDLMEISLIVMIQT